ncbi:helix-turn-helix transcriptional regulator [Rufibacter sp. LB8]|uniref:helix-turn-helix transcriptional regulator n=1 Tax=Rufibacter sp. LB8 TaxID=2777781 RepID=UPI00178C7099|nr:helix-turn-helix transcriptional regulator [Rufibacter sp. LB8]
MEDSRKNQFQKKVGQRIASLRLEKGWTQENLGDAVGGLERQAVSRIENGHHAMNSYLLLLFAEAFGLTLSEFFSYDYNPGPKELQS